MWHRTVLRRCSKVSMTGINFVRIFPFTPNMNGWPEKSEQWFTKNLIDESKVSQTSNCRTEYFWPDTITRCSWPQTMCETVIATERPCRSRCRTLLPKWFPPKWWWRTERAIACWTAPNSSTFSQCPCICSNVCSLTLRKWRSLVADTTLAGKIHTDTTERWECIRRSNKCRERKRIRYGRRPLLRLTTGRQLGTNCRGQLE